MEVSIDTLVVDISDKEKITLVGQSVAGLRTNIVIPEYSIVFDIGVCSHQSTNQPVVCVSHGHADHIGALHLHSFTRSMMKVDLPTYYMPIECVDSFNKSYESYKCLNKGISINSSHDWMRQFYNIITKGSLPLCSNMFIKPFKTIHRVPSQGYIIYKEIKKLKPEYLGLTGKEIVALKETGVEISYTVTINQLAFSGDTTIEGILDKPDVLGAKVLILECTYIHTGEVDNVDTPDEAINRGHIHEQHIIDHADKFMNQVIVFTHLSQRYKAQEIVEFQKRMAEKFQKMNIKIFDTRYIHSING